MKLTVLPSPSKEKKRNKDLTKSIFNDIKGLGAKRSAMLLQSFSGPKQIAKQTPEEIRAKTGIPMKIVKEIIKVAKNYNSSII